MKKIHNELSELNQLYREYEGVEDFVINENGVGTGLTVVMDATTVPSSFTRLMCHPNTSVDWIQPQREVTIRLNVSTDSSYQANVSD